MALIYSSFSQSEEKVLPQLEQEHAKLTQYFLSREVKEVVDYLPAYGHTVAQLTGDLIARQNEVKLFHFSGHSNAGGLDFSGADFQKEHVSTFFNTLNADKVKLECIFLNGCDNVEIVRRLSGIPVVIGTRSPILDKDAFLFTVNFFRALVGGRSSYETAFNQACRSLSQQQQGKVSATRGVDLRQHEHLPVINDYFIHVNQEKVAKRRFPLGHSTGRRILSRVQYLAILITLIVAAVVFMSWDTILYHTRGYYCPDWTDKEKCNILVGGFNGEYTNEFISDAINENDTFVQYIESAYEIDLKTFIRNSAILEKDFPECCGFDYLVTGAVDEKDTLTRVSIKTYPVNSVVNATQQATILGNLFDFRDSIQRISNIYQDQLVLTRICLSCAEKMAPLRMKAKDDIQKIAANEELAPIYQDLNEELAAIYLRAEDTLTTIALLQRVASKDINDKTLAALETVSQLQIGLREFQPAYATQTNYIQAIQARQRSPDLYQLDARPETYESARRELMLRRARLVLDQAAVFDNIQTQQALKDFQYLQSQEGDPGLYEEEINTLCDRLGSNCGSAQNEPVDLKIRSRDGAVIAHAEAAYDGNTYRANDRGIIQIPCLNEDCIGQRITVSAAGYYSREETIRRVAEEQRIYLGELPENEIELKGTVMQKGGKPVPGATVTLGNEKTTTGKFGNFSLGTYPQSNLPGEVIAISKEGYQARNISVEALLNSFEIVLDLAPGDNENTYTIYGTVRDCNFPNTVSKSILINKVAVPVLDKNGSYTYQISGKPGDKVQITPPSGLAFQNSGVGMITLGQNKQIERNLVQQEASPKKYTVKGQIVDNGEPIVGATVLLKNTASGAVTDIGGRFSLVIDGYFCHTLVVGNVGFSQKEVPLRHYRPNGQTISLGNIGLR